MKKFGSVRVFLLLILVLILSVAPTILQIYSQNKMQNESKNSKNNNYSTILSVWNVDTFDGGNTSKFEILKKSAQIFEKENKGIFLYIENLTVDEFLYRKQKELPDIISFGSGLYEQVQDFAAISPSKNNIYENIFNCSVVDGVSIATPWCVGAYYLISTQQNFDNAGKPDAKLVDDLYDLNYSKKIGKKTKEIASLTYGVDGFHSKEYALAYFGNINTLKIDSNCNKNTDYEAYVAYRSGKASVLFGTQRDLARMQNKLAHGDIASLYFEMCGKTDLVQFVAATSQNDTKKQEISSSFCSFLQSVNVQNIVAESGLLPICNTSADVQANSIGSQLEVKKIF